MRLTCCWLLWFGLMVEVQEQPTPAKELMQLEGAWQVVSMEAFGKPVPESKQLKKLVITGTKLTGLGPEMDIKLIPTKTPKWIDLTFKKDEQTYPVQAIYDLAGDELRLCIPLAQPGIPFENIRPEGFDTKEKPLALLKLKRVKS